MKLNKSQAEELRVSECSVSAIPYTKKALPVPKSFRLQSHAKGSELAVQNWVLQALLYIHKYIVDHNEFVNIHTYVYVGVSINFVESLSLVKSSFKYRFL